MALSITQLRNRLARAGQATRLCFHVTFADGSTLRNRDGNPVVRLTFRTRRAELAVALFGHVGLLESYFDQSLDIDGDIAQMFAIGFESGFANAPGPLVRLRNRFHEVRFSNRTREQARANACFHYDLGEDFYSRWLDEALMMYTCGYWREGTETLEQAQVNKVEHVCRKLLIEPGHSVVDIGCGFGGFMFHAAERHGANVCGINTAPGQVAYVDAAVRRRGLTGQLEVREADFRDVHARFDRVVSIGVLEHAGRDQLAEVVQAHADFLAPRGLGMLHFIGHVGRFETEFYIRRHIFPGGWIPSLAETIEALESAGLEVVDIENLRRHYALTLDAWAERFERNWPDIHAIDPARFDERFRRTWRTYLVACAEMFRSAHQRTHLFQIVFSKGNITRENYPMSRAFLYAEQAKGAARKRRTAAG